MNKKVVIGVVALLLLAVVGFFVLSKKPVSQGDSMMAGKSGGSAATNLKDLLTKGVAQTCTYTAEQGSGTVYMAGGKVRGDFDVTAGGQNTKSHMIVMDNTTYIWTEGQGAGLKMAYNPDSVSPAQTSPDSNTVQDNASALDTNYNYNCSTWVADQSKFDLPAGVTFSALPTQVQAAPAAGDAMDSGSSSSSQCSYCDALSGDDKTQCLTALKCN